jgi:hypothetical protein
VDEVRQLEAEREQRLGPIRCKTTILHSPDESSATNFARILRGEISQEFVQARNLVPTTDDRPFHFDVDPAHPKIKSSYLRTLLMMSLLSPFFLLFLNRFSAGRRARLSAFSGIGCWILALLLEGLRGMFKQYNAGWYAAEVLAEEVLETLGAIFLLSAIVLYVIDIALDLTAERCERLKRAARFFTRPALKVLAVTFIVLCIVGGTIYFFAQQQASAGAPVPRLFAKALKSESKSDTPSAEAEPSKSAGLHQKVWFEDLKEPVSISESDQEALMRFAAAAVLNSEKRDAALPAAIINDNSPRMIFLSLSDGAQPAKVFMGSGQGIIAAVERAVSQANRPASNG